MNRVIIYVNSNHVPIALEADPGSEIDRHLDELDWDARDIGLSNVPTRPGIYLVVAGPRSQGPADTASDDEVNQWLADTYPTATWTHLADLPSLS